MADYKQMYSKLFTEMNDTIDRFKQSLLEVENLYIETADDSDLTELELKEREENS